MLQCSLTLPGTPPVLCGSCTNAGMHNALLLHAALTSSAPLLGVSSVTAAAELSGSPCPAPLVAPVVVAAPVDARAAPWEAEAVPVISEGCKGLLLGPPGGVPGVSDSTGSASATSFTGVLVSTPAASTASAYAGAGEGIPAIHQSQDHNPPVTIQTDIGTIRKTCC